MTVETGILNKGQRYSLADLRFLDWQDETGAAIGPALGPEYPGYSPWSFFDDEDFYLGADEKGIEPIFEYDTDEQPHF